MFAPYTKESAREEFIRGGEYWVLRKLSSQLNVILDVGSNMGEWSLMAREICPNTEIHTFEVVSEIYRKFLKNVPIDSNIIPNGFGLSDEQGILKIKYCLELDVVSTSLEESFVGPFEWRDCFVVTGDQYVKNKGIGYIDFLKIDVEGAESRVLEGFKNTLKEEKIGVIQFEYGFGNVVSRFLLRDAYKMLAPLGFHIGKLSSSGVNFKNYQLTDEDFHGPNIICVHNSKIKLFQ